MLVTEKSGVIIDIHQASGFAAGSVLNVQNQSEGSIRVGADIEGDDFWEYGPGESFTTVKGVVTKVMAVWGMLELQCLDGVVSADNAYSDGTVLIAPGQVETGLYVEDNNGIWCLNKAGEDVKSEAGGLLPTDYSGKVRNTWGPQNFVVSSEVPDDDWSIEGNTTKNGVTYVLKDDTDKIVIKYPQEAIRGDRVTIAVKLSYLSGEFVVMQSNANNIQKVGISKSGWHYMSLQYLVDETSPQIEIVGSGNTVEIQIEAVQVCNVLPEPDINHKTIVFLGDSLTEITGIVETIRDLIGHSNNTIVNAGIQGNTINNIISRFQEDVADHKPDIIIGHWAVNDILADVGINTLKTRDDSLMALIEATGADFYRIENTPFEAFWQHNDAYQATMDAWIAFTKTNTYMKGYIPMYQVIESKEDTDKVLLLGTQTNDGIHFNKAVAGIAAQAVVNFLGVEWPTYIATNGFKESGLPVQVLEAGRPKIPLFETYSQTAVGNYGTWQVVVERLDDGWKRATLQSDKDVGNITKSIVAFNGDACASTELRKVVGCRVSAGLQFTTDWSTDISKDRYDDGAIDHLCTVDSSKSPRLTINVNRIPGNTGAISFEYRKLDLYNIKAPAPRVPTEASVAVEVPGPTVLCELPGALNRNKGGMVIEFHKMTRGVSSGLFAVGSDPDNQMAIEISAEGDMALMFLVGGTPMMIVESDNMFTRGDNVVTVMWDHDEGECSLELNGIKVTELYSNSYLAFPFNYCVLGQSFIGDKAFNGYLYSITTL